jgi:methionyl-tRNA formyltransferase
VSKHQFAVLGQHEWNRIAFDAIEVQPNEDWHYIDDSNPLDIDRIEALNPKMIFVLHWSKYINDEFLNRFTFVVFHMTDLPFGRGGTPLQNLIERGFENTKLTALLATKEIDAGPIFLKEDLSLNGSAQEIYERASAIAIQMIRKIVDEQIFPVEQQGDPTYFTRRELEKSELPLNLNSINALNDQIRMVDADGYPKAYLTYGNFRIELSNASLQGEALIAHAIITLC